MSLAQGVPYIQSALYQEIFGLGNIAHSCKDIVSKVVDGSSCPEGNDPKCVCPRVMICNYIFVIFNPNVRQYMYVPNIRLIKDEQRKKRVDLSLVCQDNILQGANNHEYSQKSPWVYGQHRTFVPSETVVMAQ